MRILLASLAAVIAMYVWTSVAHVATPLGQLGLSTLPNESVTVGNLTSAVDGKAGLYAFPMNMAAHSSAATQTAGLLMYNPAAPTSVSARNLVLEFLTELAECVIAIWLLAQTALTGYAARVGFVSMVGLAAVIATNVPYWNWYAFPVHYSLGYGLIALVGFVVAGLAGAAVLKPKAA